FFTLGCKANQYDTQSIRERFLSKGFSDTNKVRSDYFLINTCTVTSSADQKSRNIIRKCIRSNPRAKVIVTGCLVEKDRQSLVDIQGISLIIRKSFFPEGISSFSQHTRAFLKIQDGCSNFCSYCKVALVRGKERSKEFNQVIDEAHKLVACGYKEIVLTGICLGAYGRDLSSKMDLVDVVNALERIKGLERIRLSSIEAGDVSFALINCFKNSSKLCRHLHIPIQSGDNRILRLMNRKYTREKYLNLIKRIKDNIPGISITTDCLIGFPGETEANFKNTLDLVREIAALKVHIFPYSSRPGTKAVSFSGTVVPSIIRSRCRKMEEIAKKSQLSFMRKFIDKKMPVLIEATAKDNPDFLEGLTDNYLQVRLPFRPGLKNKVVLARCKRVIGGNFIGEYIDNP
ncbi:MAG: MiaB/RimO family radical SAM methylthiotransferase, partial [Candidatus Omnitrophota bacterium]|nr:MiaB/RimO family radical SAM methylthiotransferase [Candidatus Omnitrophota bacterium]